MIYSNVIKCILYIFSSNLFFKNHVCDIKDILLSYKLTDILNEEIFSILTKSNKIRRIFVNNIDLICTYPRINFILNLKFRNFLENYSNNYFQERIILCNLILHNNKNLNNQENLKYHDFFVTHFEKENLFIRRILDKY